MSRYPAPGGAGSPRLQVSLGQHSDKGRKPLNQDFHGACLPEEPLLGAKGVAIALADGISSSDVSQAASEAAVAGFLSDYYSTSEAWSVRTSVDRVLSATNAWLYAQTRQSRHRYDRDRGYVCTLAALVLKSTTAYLFHAGDTRIYRLREGNLEQLTQDHRVWLSAEQSCLSRALGIDSHLELDHRALPLERGDLFILATDGVHEFLSQADLIDSLARHPDDLDVAARALVELAYARGSDDNLSVQLARIDSLPEQGISEIHQQLADLALPPLLEPRMVLDGYRIVRELHASSRSHVYLALDEDGDTPVVIKTPSLDLCEDAAYLERFAMEEWIARRLDNVHVLRAAPSGRRRNYLYTVTEYLEGQSLTQWMRDNPRPDLETVRGLVEQIAKGLRAFHRQEMLHQDLRPENILIDRNGTVKIIDFGACRIAGVVETATTLDPDQPLGTAPYTAPEYFLGEGGTPRSDLFSLGVITYQMLSGRLPYGTAVAKCRTRAAQNRLHYGQLFDEHSELPAWIDDVLRKAVHPDPDKRYTELSEFTFDLRQPGHEITGRVRPLMERNPVAFWKGVSLVLAVVLGVVLVR